MLANHHFQVVCIPICQQRHRWQREFRGCRIGNGSDFHVEFERVLPAQGSTDGRRGRTSQREDGNCFVGRRRFAKELHPTPPFASKLVSQEDQSPPLLEEFGNLRAASLLGKHVLAGRSAEPIHELVEKDIIQRPCDCVCLESMQGQEIATQLEVPQMARYDHHRPLRY